MDVHWVKDRRVTPTVIGTEKIVRQKAIAKSSESSVLCPLLKKIAFAEKLSDPSLAEDVGILCSVADTATELFISKGSTYLAPSSVEAGTYYASEAMKAIN